MSPSRRDFILLGSAAAVACKGGEPIPVDTGPEPAPLAPEEPKEWEPSGTEDPGLCPQGFQSGDPTDDAVILQVRTELDQLTLTVVAAQGDAWVGVLTTVLNAVDGGIRFELTALTADTPHRYVWSDGSRRSAIGRFRTAPLATGFRQVSFGATSCLSDNQPWKLLSHAASQKLDFFCLLGDTVYADGSKTLEQYRAEWTEAMSQQGMRDLAASTSFVAAWDDHEVDNNWTADGLAEGQLEVAIQAFAEAVPWRAGGGVAGLWRSLKWGDILEVFVLDCRSERDPAAGLYLSVEQMDWLKAGLSASTARFKVIFNSVPITDLTGVVGEIEKDDRWDGYPVQRAEILDHIEAEAIGGVLWVTGDVHFGALTHVDPEGGVAWAQNEVFVGPGGSKILTLVDFLEPQAQYEAFVTVWNWVRFDCDPGTGTVRVRFMDDADATVLDRTLHIP